MATDGLMRRGLLEGLPAFSVIGSVGVVAGNQQIAFAALIPLAVWGLAGTYTAKALKDTARRQVSTPVAAVVGAAHSVGALFRGYMRLGLWRGRGVYDVAALAALLLGIAWWVCELRGDVTTGTSLRVWSGIALVVVAAGAWLRFKYRRKLHSLLQDVYVSLDRWDHKRCRSDEAAYERAIATHLTDGGYHVSPRTRLESGRDADIVVRPKDHAGRWDYRDVMIEMKAHVTKTTERDRAMGQVETYAKEWPGAVVLMVCGEYRDDLLVPVREKIDTMRAQGRNVAFVLKGRPVN